MLSIPGFLFPSALFLSLSLPPLSTSAYPVSFFPVHNTHVNMLSSIVLLSTLAATALGSNGTYNLPAGFNIGLVKPDELSMFLTTIRVK